MNWFKYFTWIILGLLGLIMAFLLYATSSPDLLVKIMGPYGNTGQLGGVMLSGEKTLVIEEIIDNDHGIGVEGGAGFAVQLKKLLIFDLKNQNTKTLGLNINTQILGVSDGLVWVFDKEKGLRGLSVETGKDRADWKTLMEANPGLSKRAENKAESFQVIDQTLWLSDLYGKKWEFDRHFRAHLRNNLPVHQNSNFDKQRLFKRNNRFINGLAFEANGYKGAFIFYYRTIKSDGFRLAYLRESGKISWNKNYDNLLDRKAENCKPVFACGYNNLLCLVLETNRGTRLVLIAANNGRVLKNLRV